MPTITISKKVFESLVGKKLPIDKLKDRISMLGTDLETIEGDEITVEVFPNRPDMLSVQGFARAFSSFIGIRTGLKRFDVKKSGEKVIIDGSVKGVRPYTACAIVKGLKFDDEKIKEVIQIQEKLHVTFGRNRRKAAIGIYPYEKIKPPIRFVAKKPEEIKFQPLEFPRVINGKQILGQHPAGREYGHLLEGLNKYPIFIDANDKILSMPPIINSHDTGKITEKTKDVFIECSGFDFNVLKKCLNIIVTSLAEMGGKICSMELDVCGKREETPDLRPTKMKLDLSYVNKLLGIELKETDAKKLLEKMGFGYDNKTALVPAYRTDILHPMDLVEDIAIAYGYENFMEDMPNISTIGEIDRFEQFKSRIAYILTGLGLLEVITYHITNKEFQQKKMGSDLDIVELANSKSKEYNVLRAWLTPSLLQVLSENKHNEYPQNIFDIGVVFKQGSSTETNVEEATRLCVLLCHDKVDFTEIKQVLDYLMNALGLAYSIEDTEHGSFISGRVGRVSVNGKKVAYIGELHPQVLTNFELDMPVAALELNLSDLFSIISN